MNAVPFLENLSQLIGSPIEASAEGSITLTVDDMPLLLQWLPADNAFLAHTDIGSVTPEHGHDLFSRLLSANFFLSETAGATLGYNPYSTQVCLDMLLFIQGLDANEFLDRVEAFLQTANLWQARLALWNSESTPAKLSSPSDEVKQTQDNSAANPMLRI